MRNKSLVLLIVLLLVATLSLTACFEVDTITVTFDSDGGTSVNGQVVTDGNTATEPTAPTKEGYTFVGWFAAGSETAFDFSTPITASITLTAQWLADEVIEPDAETFTVSFDSDGGTSVDSQTVTDGNTATEPTAPTKDGYTFVGWFVADSETAFDFGTAITADTALTAQWTADESTEPDAETFTVTFDAQNGETATGVSMDKGATVTAPETNPTKDSTAQFSYAFASWNTAADGTGDDFVADSTVSADITYYAQYTETTRTYTVTIVAGANGSVDVETIDNVPYGSVITVSDNTITIGEVTVTATASTDTDATLYAFGSWSVATDDTTDDNTTITATFSDTTAQYTYTFYDCDGTTVLLTDTVDYGTEIVVAANPTMDSTVDTVYTFAGWFTASEDGTQVTEFGTVVADVDFYAQYTEATRTYTVTFDAQNGTTAEGTSMQYGADILAPETNPTKDSTVGTVYTFAGWFTASEDGTQVTEFGTVVADTTYYAQYSEATRTYTVVWYDEDGTTELYNSTVTAFTSIESLVASGTPTKQATAQYTYTFDKWTCSTEAAAVVENISFVASYSSTTNSYTVTWYDEDGTTELYSADFLYGATPVYDSTTPTKDSTTETVFVFDSWNTSADGTGDTLADTTTVVDEATYYAQYADSTRTYTVAIAAGDNGSVDVESIDNVPYGSSITVSDNTITIGDTTVTATADGKTAQYTFSFDSWSVTAEDTTGASTTITASFVSTTNSYTVSISAGDNGSVDVDTIDNVPYGSSITVSDNTITIGDTTVTATADGKTAQYTFAFGSWSVTSDDTTGTATTITASFVSTTNSYTVTFGSNEGEVLAYGADISAPTTTPTKDSTEQYTYAFAGWSLTEGGEVVTSYGTVEGDTTYYAIFTESTRSYTITWVITSTDSDTTSVEYGTVPSYDGTPTNGDKVFGGWDTTPVAVTGTATYTAVWADYSYDVSVDGDGSVTLSATANGSYYDVVITGSGAISETWSTELDFGKADILSIVIGDGITSIPDGFMYGYDDNNSVSLGLALQSVTIGSGVTSVGVYAFSDCYSLTSVTLAEGLPYISEGMFCYCTGLESIVIPASVVYIDNFAFYGCTSLTSVAFADNSQLTTIGYYAFCEAGITSITLPDSLLYICGYAFMDSQLESIVIPSNVYLIDGYAFATDTISTAYIPLSVTEVGTYAFASSYTISITCEAIPTPDGWSSNWFYKATVTWATPVTVTYTTNGGEAVSADVVAPGTVITAPTTTQVGYVFSGWYSDIDCLELFDFDNAITADTTLYASWTAGVTITFDTNGSYDLIAIQTVLSGETATEPSPISLTGYVFVCWLDAEGEQFDFDTAITSNIVLTANWMQLVTVSFNTDGGSSVASQIFTVGGYAAEPAEPTKTGYSFTGWVDGNGTAFSFVDTAISADTALYATWTLLTPDNDSVYTVGSISIYVYGDNGQYELIFTGTGDIPSTWNSTLPFAKSSIVSITIEDGITSIPDEFMCGYGSSYALTSLYVGSDVVSIGESAFDTCTSLTSVTFADNSSLQSIGAYAFIDCAFTSVVIPDSVTYMGFQMLGYVPLTSITLPFVGECADGSGYVLFGWIFGGSTYSNNGTKVPTTLTTVVVTGGTLDTITLGNYAFYYCSSITSLTLPANLTSVGLSVFSSSDSSLMEVYFEGTFAQWCAIDFAAASSNAWYRVSSNNGTMYIDGVPQISAVSGSTLTITADVTYIGEYCFAAFGFSQIVFEEGAEALVIGTKAFYNCASLQSLYLSSNVTSIGLGAFTSCDNLMSVSTAANSQLQTIVDAEASTRSYGTFVDCDNLVSVDFSQCALLQSMGAYAFYECPNLESVYLHNNMTSIGTFAFYSCSSLSTVAIPTSVTSIGAAAFYNCESLTTITLPEGLVSLGDSVFNGCTNLQLDSIYLPTSLVSIGSSAFDGCVNITMVVLSNNIETIGADAFDGTSVEYKLYFTHNIVMYKAQSITVYTGGTEIAMTYDEDLGLYYITISSYNINMYQKTYTVTFDSDNGEDTYDSVLFANSTATAITDPTLDGYRFMGWYATGSDTAFDFSTAITADITLTAMWEQTGSEGLVFTLLADDTYEVGGGTATGDIVIPSTYYGTAVTSVAVQAFYLNTGITSVYIPVSVTTIGSQAFMGCSNLATATIDGAITTIDGNAFMNCTSLTFVYLSDNVEVLGNNMFNACTSLTEVIFGSGISSIIYGAFNSCTSLAYIYYTGTEAQWSIVLTGLGGNNSAVQTATVFYNGFWTYEDGEFARFYSVIFDSNNGSAVDSQTVAEGNTLTALESNPTRDGYDFTVWFTDIDCTEGNEFDFDTAITEPITLYAGWESNSVTYLVAFDTNGGSSVDSQDVIDEGTGAYATEPEEDDKPTKTGYSFSGWVDSNGDTFDFGVAITADTTIYATWTLDTTGATEIVLSDTVTLYSFDDGTSLIFTGTGDIPSDWATEYGTTITKTAILSVVIDDGITSIPASFMAGTSSTAGNTGYNYLNSVVIGNTVTSIGESAFYMCTLVEEIIIPEGVTTIGTSAFNYCTGLSGTLYIPASVITISAGAFRNCSKITAVVFAEGSDLVTIESGSASSTGVFTSCTSITSVNLEVCTKLTTIGDYAFYACVNITEITIPATVKTIGISAFCGTGSTNYSQLATVTFAEGSQLESIGKYAFRYNNAMTSLTIPASVTYIGQYAFRYTSLTSVVFEDTEGWWYGSSETSTSGTNVTVTSATTAATYIASTYTSKYWFKD